MSFVGSLVTLGISVGLSVVSNRLAPKPDEERRKSRRMQPVEISPADEGTPIPLVYGDVLLRDLRVVWSAGAFAQSLPHSEVADSGSSSEDLAISTVYGGSMAVMVALPTASDAIIRDVYLDDRRIVSASSGQWGGDVFYTEAIGDGSDDPEGSDERITMWGGPGKGGGVWGVARLFRGTQSVPEVTFEAASIDNTAFQANKYGIPGATSNDNQIPEALNTAYRGMMYILLRNFVFGESPRMPSISARVQSFPELLGYGSISTATGPQANPAEVIYHLLVDDFGGLGMSTRGSGGTMQVTDVDRSSFEAAAETLSTEQHGISLAVYAVQAGDVIAEILNQIDGVLYEDHETGKLHIKLIRDDYSTADALTLDPSNIDGDPQRSEIKPVANEVRLTFSRRTAGWGGGTLLIAGTKDETITARSDALIEMTGKRESLDISMPWVSDENVAEAILQRELEDASTPSMTVRLRCLPVASQLRPGDVFLWDWPDYNIEGAVMRVASVNRGELDDNRVVVEAARDRFDRVLIGTN